jgi:transglutaminase-like putative cysteine protease
VAAQRTTAAPRVALAALSAASAVGLVRVFAHTGWLVPAVLAAVLPHLLFRYGDRRRVAPPLALAAVMLLGTVFAMVVASPSTTFHGIPTIATLHAFSDNVGLATHTLRTAVVPVDPIDAALTLALVAIWMVATTADWLASRLDATLGALGPSLVLFVAIGALGKGAQWPTTLLYAAAAATFLLTQHYAELLERRTWFHLPRRRRSRLLTGGVAAVGAAALLGVVAGPLLPGARSDAWFDYRGLGASVGGGTWRTVTPLVDIRSRLVDQSDTELFTVKSPIPEYWRLVALDQFNGTVWGLQSEGQRANGDLALTEPTPPKARAIVQTFKIGPLETRWLPAAYEPRRISLPNTLVIPESGSLVSGGQTSNDAKYTVLSEVPTPTIAQLRAAPATVPPELAADLELPSKFPSDVRELALTITKNATTPYDKALALQNYLRTFTYDLHVPPGHSDHAIDDFLFKTKRGYCEQFAGSYAAMARSIGLPARVAVGFTPGTRDGAGVFHVTDKQAHAWPEVWFDHLGWMPFEPTPTRYEPSPGDPTGTGKEAPKTTPTTSATSTAPTSSTTAPKAGPTINANRLHDAFVNAGSAATPKHRHSVWPRTLLVLVALVALVVLAAAGTVFAVLGVKWRRRRRRRRALDERDRVIGAWAEALDRLREAGVAPHPSATPVEFALRHAAASGAGMAGPPLMELARLQTAALFADQPPSEAQVDDAWEQLHLIERALKRATTASRRWRRRLDPRSLRVLPRPG